MPPFSAELRDFHVRSAHWQRFNRRCRIDTAPPMSPIYPMTLVFPFFQRLLASKQVPAKAFYVLAKRLRIQQHRPMALGQRYSLICRLGEVNTVPQGLEMDLVAVIQDRGETVWEAIETFFYRGEYGIATQSGSVDFASIATTGVHHRWRLYHKDGFPFAKISGDGNPLHYSRIYARMMGFQRDFAQPFLVLGHAIPQPPHDHHSRPFFLDVVFKGPLYYSREAVLKARPTSDGDRFDIFSEGNPRPCMTGLVCSGAPKRGSKFLSKPKKTDAQK